MTSSFDAAGSSCEERDCEICAALSASPSAYVVASSSASACLMPERSRTCGSVLVVPRRHVGDMLALPADEASDLMMLTRDACQTIAAITRSDGMHLFWDAGGIADQFYPHLAIEIVPRQMNDGYVYTTTAHVAAMSAAERENAAVRLRELMVQDSCGGWSAGRR